MDILKTKFSENPIVRRFLDAIPIPLKRIYFEALANKTVPVIVYTMGKVASSSIYRSLYRQYDGLVFLSNNIYEKHKDWKLNLVYKRALHEKKPVKIISLTREPIARNLSAFFQTFKRDTGLTHTSKTFTVEELRQLFLDNFHHDLPLRWFQLRLEKIFGIDVYAVPFPETGACTYIRDNIQVLVMRAELDDVEKETQIRQFLGMDDFQLENENIGSQKNYAAMYDQFKNNVKLPPEYINKMCESKYFNHFYPPEVILLVRKRWETK